MDVQEQDRHGSFYFAEWDHGLFAHAFVGRQASASSIPVRLCVEPRAEVITDGWQGYDGLPKLDYYHTKIVMEGDPERAEEWLPMIHLVFSNLKAWLIGTHHGVSPQHLQAYLNEFTFRFNRRFYPFTAFNSLLGIGVRVEAPTYAELYSGEYRHPNPGVEKGMEYGQFLGRPQR